MGLFWDRVSRTPLGTFPSAHEDPDLRATRELRQKLEQTIETEQVDDAVASELVRLRQLLESVVTEIVPLKRTKDP